ncbi:hypothetical protein [Thioclava sp. GXIMD2076]|uniref:5-carboxymethyl-2-hydroxymuconate isomerase n=1 Tax=Thioclava kandeliae TaxID=3070818 RepID=A0ABV1SL66_9RHOB
MPILKLHVDRTCDARIDPEGVRTLLVDLRAILCERLSSAEAACQLAWLPVTGLPDQPVVNCELAILPKPERTREKLTELAEVLKARIEEVTGPKVAVRISHLDAATYVALK